MGGTCAMAVVNWIRYPVIPTFRYERTYCKN